MSPFNSYLEVVLHFSVFNMHMQTMKFNSIRTIFILLVKVYFLNAIIIFSGEQQASCSILNIVLCGISIALPAIQLFSGSGTCLSASVFYLFLF